MGDIIQYNVRGLKSIDLRQNKVNIILKLLTEPDKKCISLQETRLNDIKQIPIEFIHLKHVYLFFVEQQKMIKKVAYLFS